MQKLRPKNNRSAQFTRKELVIKVDIGLFLLWVRFSELNGIQKHIFTKISKIFSTSCRMIIFLKIMTKSYENGTT